MQLGSVKHPNYTTTLQYKGRDPLKPYQVLNLIKFLNPCWMTQIASHMHIKCQNPIIEPMIESGWQQGKRLGEKLSSSV